MTTLPFKLPAVKDDANPRLNSAIGGASTAIALQTGDGAKLPAIYRGTATSTGNETTLNSTGIGSSGVAVGDFIENESDPGAFAVVRSVSADSVRTTPLRGGSTNSWANSNAWSVNRFYLRLTQYDTDAVTILKKEKVLVTNRVGDNLTVERAQDGDSAQSFDAGDYCNLFVLKLHVEELQKAVRDIFIQIDEANRNVPAFVSSTSSGSDTLTATLPYKFASYADIDGVPIVLRSNRTVTGASTLNLNGKGAKTIKRLSGASDTAANDIQSGQLFAVAYDSSLDVFQMLSPSGTSDSVDMSNFIHFDAYDYSPLTVQGLSVPTTAISPAPALLSDDFNRADSNTVGGGWTEGAVGATSEQISTNRLQLLSVSNSSAKAYQSHGALTLPVSLYGKIGAGSSSNRPISFGLWCNTLLGGLSGITFTQQNTTQNIWVNGASVGTFSYDFSTGTNYVWIDYFANGSNLDMAVYVSTSSTKPTTPTATVTNQAYSTSNTNLMMFGDYSSTGQNVYFDEVALYQIGTPRQLAIVFDQSIKQGIVFSRPMPSNYSGGTVLARFHWAANSSSTNSVVWGIRAVCVGDNVSLSTAFGTPQTVTDANNAQAYLNRTSQTSAITIAGSPAAGKMCFFEVYRDSADASDTLAADAYLIGVDIDFS